MPVTETTLKPLGGEDAARAQVAAIYGDAERPVDIRLLRPAKPRAHVRDLHGAMSSIWADIEEAQAVGFSAYIRPNAGGWSDGDIVEVFAACVDADDVPLPDDFAWHLTPTFVVQRSPTRWQAWWALDGVEAADWRKLQLQLAQHYGGDPMVATPATLLRLAGTKNYKGDGKGTDYTLTATAQGQRYSLDLISEGLPDVKVQHTASTGLRDFEPLPVNPVALEKARKLVAKAAPAIYLQHGDDATGKLVIAVNALVPDPETALELLQSWNERCEPPWDEDDLRNRIWRNAVQSKVAPGSRITMANAEADALEESRADDVWRRFVEKTWPGTDPSTVIRNTCDIREGDTLYALIMPDDDAEDDEPKRQGHRLTLSDIRKRGKPRWLFHERIPERGVCLFWGLPGKGKTWIVMEYALRLATGMPGLGREEWQEPQAVAWYAGEDPEDITGRRIDGWIAYHKAEGDAAGVDIAERIERYFVPMETVPNVADGDAVEAFIAEFKGEKVGMVVHDTYARVMGAANLSEIDPLDVNAYVTAAERIKRALKCAVIVIHHSGKNPSLGARGSNSLVAAVDVEWEIDATGPDGAPTQLWQQSHKIKRGKGGSNFVLAASDYTFTDHWEEEAGTMILTEMTAEEQGFAKPPTRGHGGPSNRTPDLPGSVVGAALAMNKSQAFSALDLATAIEANEGNLYGSIKTLRIKLAAGIGPNGKFASYYVGRHQGQHQFKFPTDVLTSEPVQ